MTWTYVMDEAGLPNGVMVPVYPIGINVVIARVGGAREAHGRQTIEVKASHVSLISQPDPIASLIVEGAGQK
jgi:hypothetical protein